MKIRKYAQQDRKGVEDLYYKTGFLGESMAQIMDDKLSFVKRIRYYLEKEPQSIVIAEEGGRIVGYVLGCLDEKDYNSTSEFIFQILRKTLACPLMPKKNRQYWLSQFQFLVKALAGISKERALRHPKGAGHIHINVSKEYRGRGIGSKLLKRFCEYAAVNGTKLIHADSYQKADAHSSEFFIKNGFIEYSKVKTTHWRSMLPHEEIYVCCFSKKLSY